MINKTYSEYVDEDPASARMAWVLIIGLITGIAFWGFVIYKVIHYFLA